jgi:hypothetical protein
MEKKTLKLADYIQLEAELNGVVNQKNGEKVFQGLLSQKLSLNVKYWLTDLAKKIKEQTDACEALKNELIKKFGEEKEGMIQIPFFIDGEGEEKIKNPALISFEQEYSKLLEETRELEYKPIKLSDLASIETEETYSVFFSLLNEE